MQQCVVVLRVAVRFFVELPVGLYLLLAVRSCDLPAVVDLNHDGRRPVVFQWSCQFPI